MVRLLGAKRDYKCCHRLGAYQGVVHETTQVKKFSAKFYVAYCGFNWVLAKYVMECCVIASGK